MRSSVGEVREIVRAATAEAQRRRDRAVGSEHVLLGALSDPVGIGVQTLGLGVEEVRFALHKLDQEALGSVGVDPELAVAAASGARRRTGRLRLSNGAKQLLHAAVLQSKELGDGDIGARHVLLALLATKPPDPAAVLLQHLVVDLDAARASLLPARANGT